MKNVIIGLGVIGLMSLTSVAMAHPSTEQAFLADNSAYYQFATDGGSVTDTDQDQTMVGDDASQSQDDNQQDDQDTDSSSDQSLDDTDSSYD